MRRLFWLVLVLILAACGGDKKDKEQSESQSGVVEAIIAVERAAVFPIPDRNAAPITYLYERERIPIAGQSADGAYLLVTVEQSIGWILRAQVDISGSLDTVAVVDGETLGATPSATVPEVALVTAAPSTTPDQSPTPTDVSPLPAQTAVPTRTPLPTLTPTNPGEVVDPNVPVQTGTADANAAATSAAIRPGSPPPLTITLPKGWQSIDLIVPFRTVNAIRDVPLTIYNGPLPSADGASVNGYIYLFWGFPNVTSPTGEFNLWADGLQILRGSLVSESCNLGINQEQQTFYVGGQKAVGTYYTAVSCDGETDTAGWFAALRMYGGSYAFFTAVEPLDTLPEQSPNIQAILDSVVFLPPEE
ncbi:MAG: hypothetical protein EHM39_03115 [Chloroflexi bacterium]|nr:MAG: hypothetical protein EHM39_03115 [Chloroflexota bacterium]